MFSRCCFEGGGRRGGTFRTTEGENDIANQFSGKEEETTKTGGT